jgi:plasmid stability protein
MSSTNHVAMATRTIRNLPDLTHRALKTRARRNGRSTEAEVREILRVAAQPAGAVRMGDALAALGQSPGGLDLPDMRGRAAQRVATFE